MTTKADATVIIDGDARGANKAFEELNRRGTTFADTMNSGAGGMRNFNGTLKSGQERVEKLATATSGLASVMGGLGSTVGATFGAMSNLAMVLLTGPGGGVLAVIAALGAGLGLVAGALMETKKETEALDSVFPTLATTINDQLKNAIDDAKASLRDLRTELQNFGKTTMEVRRDDALARAASAAIALGNLPGAIEARRSRIAGIKTRLLAAEDAGVSGAAERLREQLADENKILDTLESRVALRQSELDVQSDIAVSAQEFLDKEKGRKAADEAEKKRNAERLAAIEAIKRQWAQVEANIAKARLAEEKAKGAAKGRPDMAAAELEDDMRRVLVSEEKGNATRLEAEKKLQREKTAAAAKALKEQQDAIKKAEEETKQLRKRYAEEAAAFATSVLTSGLNMWLTVVESGIRRQKIDFAAMIAGFIRDTGQQIFGIGVKYAIEGAGMIAMSGGTDPRGYATAAVGAAGMAVGAAMATGGTALGAASALQGAGAAGGGGGAPRSTGGRGGGAGGGGGAATGEGEGGAVTIVYNGGVHMGDTSSDRAIALRRHQRLALREVYSPEGA